jgi:diadenosine tetraphosphatase ApaH/serine/threonine PP2A family protein phosphatase
MEKTFTVPPVGQEPKPESPEINQKRYRVSAVIEREIGGVSRRAPYNAIIWADSPVDVPRLFDEKVSERFGEDATVIERDIRLDLTTLK